MDTKVRKLITNHRMHHPKANIELFDLYAISLGIVAFEIEKNIHQG